MLSLIPKSGFAAQEICEPSPPDPPSDVEMTLVGPSSNLDKTEAGTELIPQVSDKEVKPTKNNIDAAAITLVHGDVLVLVGDDFEVICLG